jgi:soluble lytic murein transglycosylase-like protein
MIANDKDAAQAGPVDTSGEQHSAATPTGEIAAQGPDLEEKIANQIGEERADTQREATVTYAIDRYGIAEDLAQEIYDAASEAGIDAKLAYGLVKTESSFKQRAVSHVGARGLTQVMPRTARWLRPGTRADDLFDRKTNLSLGFNYLNQLIGKYRGDVKLALTAYNRGPGTVDKVLKRGGNPDNGYAGKVMKG